MSLVGVRTPGAAAQPFFVVTPIASGFTHSWEALFAVRLVLGLGMGAKWVQIESWRVAWANNRNIRRGATVPVFAGSFPGRLRQCSGSPHPNFHTHSREQPQADSWRFGHGLAALDRVWYLYWFVLPAKSPRAESCAQQANIWLCGTGFCANAAVAGTGSVSGSRSRPFVKAANIVCRFLDRLEAPARFRLHSRSSACHWYLYVPRSELR